MTVDRDGEKHCGVLKVDGTCAPADINYPTDVKLLNKVREISEGFIDRFDLRDKNGKRIRTYRKNARKSFTQFSKNCKKNRHKEIRRQVKAQLGFIKRNLDSLARLLDFSRVYQMSEKDLERLTVIMRVYSQQEEMYRNEVHQCGDRIVSVSQPWVRPIKRGKAGADTEFGLKVTFCKVDGNVYVGKMSFDNYNEGDTLIEIIENYYRDFKAYPVEVLADQIYHNKMNRDYCKKHLIKFIGKKLGRKTRNEQKAREQRKEEYKAMCDRIEIEGCFGRGKRKFGLNRIKMKLKSTTMTHVALIALIMNLG